MNPAAREMRVLGLLTGVSYVSGVDYFQGINERVAQLIPRDRCSRMSKNARLVLACVDCDTYVDRLEAQDNEGCAEYLMDDGVRRLAAAGADVLVVCSNTAHLVVPKAQSEFPQLDVLHIADTTAAAARRAGVTRVGLLGTEPTMRDGSWLKTRLAAHGLEVVMPEAAATQRRIYDIICQELSFNVLKDDSRAFIIECARELVAGGAGGVLLGCTELELLVDAAHAPDGVRLFRSAELHIEAAATVAVGLTPVWSFEPPMELAARYGRLANAHDIEGIAAMMSEGAECYGREGRTASISGIEAFHAAHCSLVWRYGPFEAVAGRLRVVAFSFERFWREKEDGAVLMSAAREEIAFDGDGKILRIAHIVPPSLPIRCVGGFPEGVQPQPSRKGLR